MKGKKEEGTLKSFLNSRDTVPLIAVGEMEGEKKMKGKKEEGP